MKFNSIYNSFSAGELSRSLKGRTDLEEYFKGVDVMTNFITNRQGGASFRTGTVCVNGATNTAAKLVVFSPRDDENYVVVLQPGRSFQITNSDGTPGTITQPTYPWNERIDFSSSTNAYSLPSDDDTHRELVDSLQEATSGDVMIIVDGTGRLAPIVLLRTAANTFVVDSMILPSQNNALSVPYLYPPVVSLRVPYKDPNIDTNIRLVPSATTGTITITSENASAASIPFFAGNVIGMLVKIVHGSTTGVARITAQASTSSVTAVVQVAFGATTAATNFETSYWNPNDGYPRTVCFHDGRLIFGGNINYPDTMWCSKTGNIYHFMQRRLAQDSTTNASGLNYFGAVAATDPFNFIPAAVGANNIQWLFPAESLLVGTTGNEFSITGGQESTMSVGAIFVKPISSHGSSKVQPVKVGSSVFFASTDGKRVLEIPKRLVEYTSATDVTGISAGIVEKSIENVVATLTSVIPIRSKITKMTWDEANGHLWCVTKNYGSDDTALVSLTLDRTSKVIAWAKHVIGGTPFVSSVASIPDSTDIGNTRVFLILKRPSAAFYSVESFSYKTMHESFLPSSIGSSYTPAPPMTTYMDGSDIALTTLGVTTSISLTTGYRDRFAAGAIFGVVEVNSSGVGTYKGSFAESGGVITMTVDPAKTYIVGALYTGEIKTMPIEAGAQFGVAQGSPRRTHEISIFVDRSCSGVYKASKSSNQFPIVGSKGTPTALYTGEVKLSLNASPDDHQIVIKQLEPYPLTVLWLLTKGYTYDA